MKRLFYSIALMAFLPAVVSCERDISEADSQFTPEVKGTYRLEASIAQGADTRTQLTEQNELLYAVWTAGDQIAVVGANGLVGYGLAEGGGLTAAFVGESAPSAVAGADYYAAVYPYESAFYRTDGDVTLGAVVPAEQTYVPASFAEEAMPMAAFWKEGDESVLFKPMAAAIRLNLYATEATSLASVKITATPESAATAGRDCALVGEVAVTARGELYADYAVGTTDYALADDGGAFVLAPAASGATEVTVKGPIELSTDAGAPTEVYVVVAPASYPEGFIVTLTTDAGAEMEVTADDPFVEKQMVGGEEKPVLLPGDILDMPVLKFEAEEAPTVAAPLKLKPTFVLDGQNLFYYENAPVFIEGDRMGVIFDGRNIPANYTLENDQVYFVTEEEVEAAAGTQIMCYFPYSEEASVVTEVDPGYPDLKVGTLRVPLADVQTQHIVGASSMDADWYPTAHQYVMCGDGNKNYYVTTGEAGEPIDVPMSTKSLATWKFSVNNLDQSKKDEMLESLTINMGGSQAYFGGELLFDNAAGGVTFNPSLTEATVTLLQPVKLDYGVNHLLAITGSSMKRGTYLNTDGFTVTVTTDKATYTVYTIDNTQNNDELHWVISPSGTNTIGVNIGADTPNSPRLVGVPFTVGNVLYDYMDRPSDGTIYGSITMRDGIPWDLLGYEITSIDESVVALYIDSDTLENWESLSDEELKKIVVEEGARITEPGIVEVEAREGGPSSFLTGVAVVAEFANGTQEVYRTHTIATVRGNANFQVWE